MLGELYTCIRCNKRRFVPGNPTHLPNGWSEIGIIKNGTYLPNGVACKTCSEVYSNFTKSFVENRDFSMYRCDYHSEDIIEKEVAQNGSDETAEELDPCSTEADGQCGT